MFRPLPFPVVRVACLALAVALRAAPAQAHVLETTAGAGPEVAHAPPPLEPLSHPDVDLAPLPWRPPLPPTLVEHGPRTGNWIALTFDACTSNGSSYEGRITDVLVRTHTPATIFLGGKWMLREAQHVRELAAFPFLELGLHGYTHPHLTRATDERIAQELMLDEEVLYGLTGRRADLFRPPFGAYDDRVLRIAGSLGFLTVDFDAASGDADPRATRVKLLDWVPRIVKPGSIVVMHINGRGWHTAEALEDLITTLRHRGYELVTVSELLGRRAEAAGMVRWDPSVTAPAPTDAALATARLQPGLPALAATLASATPSAARPKAASPCPDDDDEGLDSEPVWWPDAEECTETAGTDASALVCEPAAPTPSAGQPRPTPVPPTPAPPTPVASAPVPPAAEASSR